MSLMREYMKPVTAIPWSPGRCLIVAEVGQAHDGSLGLAHAYVEAVARAGCDAVKFQIHIAEAESTRREQWRVRFSPQDESRFDYWKRMEFTGEQWEALIKKAVGLGLRVIVSPFSVEAIELVKNTGVSAWKVASGEVNNFVLLSAIVATEIPVILSSGMSSNAELEDAVDFLNKDGVPWMLMQCTSSYPCPYEKVGLNCLEEWRDRYSVPIGLSDHSASIYPGLAAVTLGCDALEVHVIMSREMFGPDVPASLTTQEISLLVEGVRAIEIMKANPVDKNSLVEEMTDLRRTFSRSIVARKALPEGTLLTQADLAVKKPGGGLPPERLTDLLGCVLLRELEKDELLEMNDIDVRGTVS